MTLALLLSAAAAWYMTGVIWTVQRVHYALFPQVGPSHWEAYHTAHTRQITPIVLLPMTIELLSSGWLAAHWRLFPQAHALVIWGFLLALATWLVTFFVSVPLHNQLGRGHNSDAIHRLIHTNWARTLLWSAHSLIVFALLWERLTPQQLLR